MKKGKVALGTMAALAVGAIAGILFAPEKGSKIRKQIGDKTNDYVNTLKSQIDKFSDLFKEKIHSAKKDADTMVDKGKANYYHAKKEVKNTTTNI